MKGSRARGGGLVDVLGQERANLAWVRSAHAVVRSCAAERERVALACLWGYFWQPYVCTLAYRAVAFQVMRGADDDGDGDDDDDDEGSRVVEVKTKNNARRHERGSRGPSPPQAPERSPMPPHARSLLPQCCGLASSV